MIKGKKIKLIHSFPEKENKFEEHIRNTFDLELLVNKYKSNLAEVKEINKYDAVILHFLRFEDCDFLINHKINIPVIWFCWGGDILNQGKFYNKFLKKRTKQLRRKISFDQGIFTGLKQIIKEIFPFTIDYSGASRVKLSALKKVNYIVPVMPGDYFLIKKYYDVNFELHHLNYVNPLVEKDVFEGATGENILLGNSASYTNNHIDAIDQLYNIDLENRKLIIPLSYGNTKIAEYIAEYAINKLGSKRVIILKDFIPFSKYNKILKSCEIVVMNHIRQQAVGNIIQSLLNGAHIYLREESTVYQYLKDKDFIVSSLNNVSKLVGLSEKEIIFNRAKAKEVFGAKAQHMRLVELMDRVL